jgi:nucleoside-diphosphate-sugar epimerase
MIDWVVEAGGGTKPPIAIPPDIALRFAAIKDWVECRWRPHHHPRFNRHSIALLQADKAADKSKAERELGWTPGPVREAVFEHVRWLVDRT